MTRNKFLVTSSVIVVLLVLLGFFDVVFTLLFGWLSYLIETLPRVQVNWLEVCMSVVTLLMFSGSLHVLITRVLKLKIWRVSWTALASSGIVVLFVAGIALVGVAHQVIWLTTSPDPIIISGMHQSVHRMKTQNNQRNIGLALNQYVSEHKGYLPSGGEFLSNGVPSHGWATHTLPYLDQQELYNRLDLNDRWDAEQNRDELATKINLFYTPSMTDKQKMANGYATIAHSGNVHVMGADHATQIDTISVGDGTSQTILLGEINSRWPAWGSPMNYREPALGINKHPNGFGSPTQNGANMIFCDGRCQYISSDIDLQILSALATPDGGEEIDRRDF